MKCLIIIVSAFFVSIAPNCFAQQNSNFSRVLNKTTTVSPARQYSNRKTMLAADDAPPMVGMLINTNIPSAPFGVNVSVFMKKIPIGFFGEMKFKSGNNGPTGTDYTGQLSQSQIENDYKDEFKGARTGAMILSNLAAMGRVSKKVPLYVYAGIGFKNITHYRQYFDNQIILGDKGYYYIREDADNEIGMTGGIMYVGNRGLMLQAGFDTNPGGFVLGIGVLFSRYWE